MTDADDLGTILASFVSLLAVDSAAASSLGPPFDLEVIAATSARAAALDEAQIDFGEGPGWDAYSSGRVAQSLLDDDARAAWPFLTSSPLIAGVEAVTALPLSFGHLRIGAVTLSRSTTTPLDAARLAAAADLATALGRTVIARALAEAQGGDDVRDPAFSRREVHQATGMVVSQLGTTPADALLALRPRVRSLADRARRGRRDRLATPRPLPRPGP